MTRRGKLTLSLSALAFTAGVLHSHQTGTLSPGLPVGTAIAGLGLVTLLWSGPPWVPITASVSLGALYRVSAFGVPSTLLNFDPDAHAVRSQIVMQTGSTQDLIGVFYATAAAFDVHGAEVALITGLPIEDAYVFYPLAIGILIPLLAGTITNVILEQTPLAREQTMRAVGCATLLGAVESSTIQYGAGPIPLTYSALLFACAILAALWHTPTRRPAYLGVLILSACAMVVSAKVPLLLFTGAAVGWVVFAGLVSVRKPTTHPQFSMIPFLFVVLLALQWLFMTEYFSFGAGVLALLSKLTIISAPPVPPTAATMYSQGIVAKLLSLSNYLLLLAGSGLAWLYFAYYRNTHHHIRGILATCAITVGFILPNMVLGTGPGFKRAFVYTAPFACALIPAVIVLITTRHRHRLPRRIPLAGVLVFALVVASVGSAAATPDQVGGHRFHLTQSEVEGKYFANTHVPHDVYMDVYYGDEVVNFPRAARGSIYNQQTVPQTWNRPLLSRELLERTLLTQDYQYVAFRPTVDVYRLKGGRYRLTWDPGRVLDTQYNRVYSSGGANIYRNPHSPGVRGNISTA